MCFIGIDHVTELRSTGKEKTCELPDGNIITVMPGVSIEQVSSLRILRLVTLATARTCTLFPAISKMYFFVFYFLPDLSVKTDDIQPLHQKVLLAL